MITQQIVGLMVFAKGHERVRERPISGKRNIQQSPFDRAHDRKLASRLDLPTGFRMGPLVAGTSIFFHQKQNINSSDNVA